jgi:hypothetical protein
MTTVSEVAKTVLMINASEMPAGAKLGLREPPRGRSVSAWPAGRGIRRLLPAGPGLRHWEEPP